MKGIIKKIGIIAGILLITGPLISGAVNGFTIGYLIPVSLGLLLVAMSLWFTKLPKKFKMVIGIFITTCICFFLIVTGIVVVRGANNTVDYYEDCVIVLGSGIRGEQILSTLQRRLEACLMYHHKNKDAFIIVSGGQGPNETIPEAEAMKRWLVSHGIPASQITKEDKSHNTKENFINTKLILNFHFPDGNYTVACLTSHYHIFRSERIARKQGFNVRTYSADVDRHLLPFAYIREFLSILKYWITG